MKFDQAKIGIVGGRGQMGRWCSNLFINQGFDVLFSDHKTLMTPEEMVGLCNVIIISVPISETIEVIKKLGPLVPEKALLIDLTSIKREPVEAMLKYSNAEVVGTHPLFGPNEVYEEQRIAICPGRGEAGLAWITQILINAGLKTIFTTPEKHDQLMGIIQGVNHFTSFSLFLCLKQSGFSYNDFIEFSTKNFENKFTKMCSLLEQPPELFCSLLMGSDISLACIELYHDQVDSLMEMVRRKDTDAFINLFEGLKRELLQKDSL